MKRLLCTRLGHAFRPWKHIEPGVLRRSCRRCGNVQIPVLDR